MEVENEPYASSEQISTFGQIFSLEYQDYVSQLDAIIIQSQFFCKLDY